MTNFKYNGHNYKFHIREEKYDTYIAHFKCSVCDGCSMIIHADTELTQAQCEKYVIDRSKADESIGRKVNKCIS